VTALLAAAAFALLAAMAMMLARALMGPTAWDRLLAVNSFGTKTVLLVALLGAFVGRPHFLDIAIAFALINFVTTIAAMKYFRYRSLALSLAHAGDVDPADGAREARDG
jgi:multicomponent Na+:H+ antiporter subunit F